MNTKIKMTGVSLLIGLWLVAIGYGSAWLNSYSTTPGKSAAQPVQQWPSQNHDLDDANRPILAMFVHPQCPCTRATLGELARLQHDLRGFDTQFYFFAPADEPAHWAETDLWKHASSLSNHPIRIDREGTLAKQLGAHTSGHCVLVAPGGQIRYSGGLTSARGHEGDNHGRTQLEQILNGEQNERTLVQFPVFGCPIHTPIDELEISETEEATATCCQQKTQP